METGSQILSRSTELAAHNSLSGDSLLVCLRHDDIPEARLNEHKPRPSAG